MSCNMRNIIFAIVAGIAILTGTHVMAGSDLPGAGKKVMPARPNWDSFWFGQKIVDIGMERLGYEVADPVTMGPPAIFTSIARGDLMYSVDTILPNHADLYEKTKEDVMPVGPIMNPGTIQGFMVDKKTADKYNIRYLEDFKDPKVAALFDQDGDGRADMVGPSASWTGSSAVATNYIKNLGLSDRVHLVQGEYTTLSADAVGRYSAGEPIFLYTWYPNPTTMTLKPGKDLVWLQVHNVSLPDDQMEKYKPQDNLEGCASNPCDLGWLPTVYYIAVNRKWAAENSAAMKFFDQFEMHLQDRAEQNIKMMQGENREEDIERHAREWIENNKEKFDSWIDAAITAAN
ncbi:glycine betaine/L-proline ABC transporter substrate-binding protein ProX [Salinicola peritrichatus]|uniref:glycine betaine/L-proline ABC transporter substrate-binding protein ProX n=1 Tax=Salinicola peritrichatus TaxID=1267424 RepID=UPI000DA2428A|nr:glycine betaine/L-proline ABC transporter substrate-binding protein ProX [Salinicola peritrichatus]